MLLALLLTLPGQCGPAGCPAPASFLSSQSQFFRPIYINATPDGGPVEGREYRWLEVIENGQRVQKWGWMYAGKVCFFPKDQAEAWANRRQAETASDRPRPLPNPPRIDPPANCTCGSPQCICLLRGEKPDSNIKPPEPPKPERTPIEQAPPLTGVDSSRLFTHGDRENYEPKGEKARRFVEQVQGKPSLVDDSQKPFLTVVGTPEQTKPVMDAIHGTGELARMAKLFHVHEYKPDSKYITGIGFPTAGAPMIYVQNAGGRVLHQQRDYGGGEANLVFAINQSGALRKPNPDFHPDSVPDHRAVQTGPALAFLAAGVVLLVALALPKKNSQ